MDRTALIPLFPLSLVVFPGQPVPLHIFEERYKAMIIDCSPGNKGEPFAPFGISMQLGGKVEKVGCSVVVSEITERFADGSFDIVTRAQRRYSTGRTFDEHPYLTGEVEYFNDDGAAPVEPGMRREALERYAELLELAARDTRAGDGNRPRPPEVGDVDSFTMAARAGLGLRQKQQLLEMRSEGERLEALVAFFGMAIPQYRERIERQHRARGNGKTG